jgi:hypothetical protein
MLRRSQGRVRGSQAGMCRKSEASRANRANRANRVDRPVCKAGFMRLLHSSMSNPQWLGEAKKVPCSQYDEKRGDPAQLESSTPSAKNERDGSEMPGRQKECLPIPKPIRGAVAPRCFFSSRTCHGGEIIPQLPSLQNLHCPSSTGVATSNNSAAQQAASSEPLMSARCDAGERWGWS